MANGIYSAVAGSVAQMRNLDVLAHNLAHVDTPGFKGESLRFEEALDAAQQGTGFVDTPGTRLRLTQGALRKTDNTLDVAIAGDGFFVVDTPQGERLTRAGRFLIGSDGNLRTANGHMVLGAGGPIAIPVAGDASAALPITIDRGGHISRGDQKLGQLRRVSAGPEQLQSAGGSLFAAAGGVEQLPEATSGEVLQGHIEEANVNPIVSMTQLIGVQRTFEALQQAVKTYREIDGQSIRRLR